MVVTLHLIGFNIPWGLTFGSDSTNLIIYKPGDSTQGVKIPC
jgi:hypothetical protein